MRSDVLDDAVIRLHPSPLRDHLSIRRHPPPNDLDRQKRGYSGTGKLGTAYEKTEVLISSS
jgi:hypothetical protein